MEILEVIRPMGIVAFVCRQGVGKGQGVTCCMLLCEEKLKY